MITHERRRRAHNYGAWINNPIDKSPTAPTAATGDSSTDAQKTLKNRGSEKVEGMLRVQCDRAGGRRRPIPISWEQRREGQEEGENEYKLLFGSVPSYPSPLHLFPFAIASRYSALSFLFNAFPKFPCLRPTCHPRLSASVISAFL